MAGDLVRHVLQIAGFRSRTLSVDERRAPGRAPVVVLVDPEAHHWDAALFAGRVVVLIEDPSNPLTTIDLALKGADAMLHLDAPPEEVARIVNVVAAGGAVLDPSEVRALLERVRRGTAAASSMTLTARERDILLAIDQGLSVKQTARLLGIADKTVENLQGRLYRKLGVRNRAQALWEAHARKLLHQAS